MLYFDMGNGSKLSLGWLGVGVGCVLTALAGLLVSVLMPDATLSFYLTRLSFVFVLGFGLTLAYPLPSLFYVWEEKIKADANEHWARGQHAVNSVKVEVVETASTDEAAPQTVKREVPIYEHGKRVGEAIVEEVVNPHDAAWRAALVSFVRWADHLQSWASAKHIGVSVSDPDQWVTLTNALRDSGYLIKGNGLTTTIHPDWTHAGIVAALNHGGRVVHPDAPPPLVKVR